MAPWPCTTSAPSLRNPAHHVRHRDSIARSDVAAHGNAGQAEGERWSKLFQRRFAARSAGVAVGDQTDVVAARDLLAGKVEHVPEEAADRRAKYVQDAQRRHRIVPSGAIAAATNDDKLRCRIERIPTRLMECPTELGVAVVNKR